MLKSPNLQHYLNTEPTKGIIRIYNLQNEKSLLVKSENIIEDTKKIRFKLDLGFFSNAQLQKDYSEIGLELFQIDPFLICDDNDNLDTQLIKAKQILEEKNIQLY